MTAALRVGLAGAGMVSGYHLPAWRALGEAVVLCAIADPDVARAQARAAEHCIPRVYPDLAQMLRHETLDAVDVMTPPHHHADHCRQAAAAGAAILCQKPLAPTWQAAAALVDDLDGRVRLMVHENWRFRPHYRQVAQWLREGRIGRLQSGSLRTASSGLLAGIDGHRPALVRQPLLASLPRLMIAEVLVHHLDVAIWLTGADRLQSASIVHAVPEVPGESAARLRLSGSDGIVVDVAGDMADPAATTGLRDALRLNGSRGEIGLAGDSLWLRSDEQTLQRRVDLDRDYRASYAGAIAHFVNALGSGAAFETSAPTHLRVLSLVDEAYAADAAPGGEEPR